MSALGIILLIVGILFGLYLLLFLVFFFDLDGKLIFKVVEPWLIKHYSKIERRDPLKAEYPTDTPDYKYNV